MTFKLLIQLDNQRKYQFHVVHGAAVRIGRTESERRLRTAPDW